MKIFQKGFNFSEDVPGNRLVYHVAGCNMRCRWCANPEGFSPLSTHTEMSAKQIVDEAESCRKLFFDGGGVTFTGGEVTLCADELIGILGQLWERGIHTAIETNGTSERLPEIWQHVDYLIMDFKHYDDGKMLQYTGVSAEAVKRNYERIVKEGRQCHIRIPLIREFNGDAAEGLASYFSHFPSDSVVFEFLKYHEFGKDKWQDPYLIRDGFVSQETVKKFKDVFLANGLVCVTT